MKNLPLYYILALIIGLMIYRKQDQPHTCQYTRCPYQGLSNAQGILLNDRLNDTGTDSYCIDSLHLVNPAASYDQIDSILFSEQ